MKFEFANLSEGLPILCFKEFCLKESQLLRSRTFLAVLLENTGVQIEKNTYCGTWGKQALSSVTLSIIPSPTRTVRIPNKTPGAGEQPGASHKLKPSFILKRKSV